VYYLSNYDLDRSEGLTEERAKNFAEKGSWAIV